MSGASDGETPVPPRPFVLWLTGLPGAGKTTLATRLAALLRAQGQRVEVLDGDEVRQHLSPDLGFSRADRDANILRIGYVAQLLERNGVVTIVAAVSPYAAARDRVRARVRRFVEVHVDCSLAELRRRDPKGLYRRADAGELPGLTGVSDPYEPPAAPEVHVDTERRSVDQSVTAIVEYLAAQRLVAPPAA